MDDRIAARSGLTFGQAEGFDPLPRQLAIGEVSPELTAAMWAIFYGSLQGCRGVDTMGYGVRPWMNDPWKTILYHWFINHEFGLADEYVNEWEVLVKGCKSILTSQNYVKRFNFIQYVLLRPEAPRGLEKDVSRVFEATRSAYRVIDRHIVPISSEEQSAAIHQALAVARAAEAQGPRAHLQSAARCLSGGEWVGAVRESIHAVEAAAKSIEPSAETLGPALSKLRTSIDLNPVLASAFGKLYGFTCGEDGVRHSLVFAAESKIEERDALFMFGACAAFVAYLLSASKG